MSGVCCQAESHTASRVSSRRESRRKKAVDQVVLHRCLDKSRGNQVDSGTCSSAARPGGAVVPPIEVRLSTERREDGARDTRG